MTSVMHKMFRKGVGSPSRRYTNEGQFTDQIVVGRDPPAKDNHNGVPYDSDATAPTEVAHLTYSEDSASLPADPWPDSRRISWRPWWLRRRILALFAALFFSISASTAALFFYSVRHQGITGSRDELYYLWKFGPAAIFVIASSAWSRVELQALKYTPWMQLALNPGDGRRLLPLDYTTMYMPQALLKTFRNRHWLAAVVLLTTLLIRIQIILSTGLLHLSTITVETEIPIRIVDSFQGKLFPAEDGLDPSNITNIEVVRGNPKARVDKLLDEWEIPIAFYAWDSIRTLDLPYPFGLHSDLAYQRFHASQDILDRYGEANVDVRATVQALSTTLECEVATSCSYAKLNVTNVYTTFEVAFNFAACSEPATQRFYANDPRRTQTDDCDELRASFANGTFEKEDDFVLWTQLPMRLDESSQYLCDGLRPSDADDAFLVTASSFRRAYTEEVCPGSDDVLSCAAVACRPRVQISEVAVVHGSRTNQVDLGMRKPLQDLDTIIEPLFTRSIPAEARGFGWDALVEDANLVDGIPSWFPGPVFVALAKTGSAQSFNLTTTSISNEQLKDAVVSGWEAFGPTLGHYLLRQNETRESSGVALISQSRLKVQSAVGVAIWVLSAISCILMSLLSLFWAPRDGVFTRDPGTLLGVACLIDVAYPDSDVPVHQPATPRQNSLDRMLKLVTTRRNGAANAPKTHESRIPLSLNPLGGSHTTAGLLRKLWRVPYTLATVLLIVVLFTTLHVSESKQGLATISDRLENSGSILWTSLPTLIFFLVATYMIVSNSIVRTLGQLALLSAQQGPSQLLDQTWLDMFGPRVLISSIRWRCWQVAAFEVLSILAGFLTILSGTLFSVHIVPTSQSVILNQQASFVEQQTGLNLTDGQVWKRKALGGILLLENEANFTYPQGTYANLAFPGLASSLDLFSFSSNLSTEAVVPAIRLEAECSAVPEKEYNVSYQASAKSPTEDGATTAIGQSEVVLIFSQSISCANGSANAVSENIELQSQSFFTLGSNDSSPFESSKQALFYARIMSNPTLLTSGSGQCPDGEPPSKDEQMRSVRWAWGPWSEDSEEISKLANLWECEYRWTEVDVRATFVGVGLEIDHSNPPVALDNTSRPFDELPVPGIWSNLEDGRTSPFPDFRPNRSAWYNAGDMAREFRLALSPYGPVTVDDLGDSSRAEQVLEAVNSRVSLIAAQVAALELKSNATSRRTRKREDQNNLKFDGQLTDLSRKRLIQNRVPTYILVGILFPIALINAWAILSAFLRGHLKGRAWSRVSWLLPDLDYQCLAPDNYISIAANAQLWTHSNIFRWLPPGTSADLLSRKQLEEWFADKEFRLGWFRKETTGEEVFTIGALGDPNLTFLCSYLDRQMRSRMMTYEEVKSTPMDQPQDR